jgi:hypothetical protein
MSFEGDTWIETTAYRGENRTVWFVRHEGAIVRAGEVDNDPSGTRAFEEAATWARVFIAERPFNWKHHQVKTVLEAVTTPELRRIG